MAGIAEETILTFLAEVGRRYSRPTDLLLLGGSALCLLGSPRPTLDIDYVGDDLAKTDLQLVIDQVAQETGLEVEAVPISGFVPLPEDSDKRNLRIGQFGAVQVFVLDPYAIALSKIDRGFDSDIEDVVFLIHRSFVQFEQLELQVQRAATRAGEFSLSPTEMVNHLQAVRDLL